MRKKVRTILLVIVVVGVVLILNANLLFPWQWMAHKNKRAVLKYANANHSDAKFVKAYYRTTKFNPENRGHDEFVFEQDGIEFSIFVQNGRIATDFYWTAFAEHQLYNTYIKPFIEPRNITAEFSYTVSKLRKFFIDNPEADISQFEGSIGIGIYDSECTNPRSLGWLYDFHCYCKENIPFKYTITIICIGNTITYSNEREFKNEDDFYNSFR